MGFSAGTSASPEVPAGLVGAHPLFDFEALQLAGGGAGQVVLPDFVVADALGRGHLLRQSFDVEANDFFGVDDLALLEHVEVGHDHGIEAFGVGVAGLGFQAHHADFLDEGRLQVVGFDLFGINVFAVGEDDEFLAASGDEQIAAGIEVAEVAGIKPAVLEAPRRLRRDGSSSPSSRWRRG